MKTRSSFVLIMPALLAFSIVIRSISIVHAQGTAFTYQGQLQNNGNLAGGTYNLQFSLYTNAAGGTAIAGPVTTNGVAISNGLFTVTIDFESGVWNGATNWLQIGVETNGAASFSLLTPRQEVTPSPYSIFAEGANAAGLSGTVPMSSLSGIYGGTISLTNPGNSFTGNGNGLANVNAVTLDGLAAGNLWQVGGNSGVPAGSNYIGINDNQYLDIHANGVRVFRLRLFTDGLGVFTNAPNILGGSSVNLTAPNVVGAVIGGGGGNDTNGNSFFNEVYADFGTIGGGGNNRVGSQGGTVSGGFGNIATNAYAMVGGGVSNTASSTGSFIGGGQYNYIVGLYGVIGGGYLNTNFSFYSTVGGGLDNVVNGGFSTVAGGQANTASGTGSFIGGGGTDGLGLGGNQAEGNAAAIGGGMGNSISSGGSYAFIGGGINNSNSGEMSAISGGYGNYVSGTGSYIGGGGFDGSTFAGNTNNANAATIGGGLGNRIQSGSKYAFIGGGVNNSLTGDGSFIGGGGFDGNYYFANTINDAGATICGGAGNSIPSGGAGAFIGGGESNFASGSDSTVGGGYQGYATGIASFVGGGGYDENFLAPNQASGAASVIVGGVGNICSGADSVIGGGDGNTNSGIGSFIGGGGYDGSSYDGNFINANAATIGGGYGNSIFAGSRYATIGGGALNQASAYYGTVAGGNGNQANGQYSMSPGGIGNIANGMGSFAAGSFAKAGDDGSFVWSDGTETATSDSAANQFVARASGGFFFYTGTGSSGAKLAAGATAWTTICDRNAKKNFRPVDTVAVLDKLAAVPIEQWNYKWEGDNDTPNIGPMAQDFKHAFYPGRDDKGITTLEFDGVELAAIQGLNQKLNEKDAEIQRQSSEIAELKSRLEALEQIVLKSKSN